MGERLTAANHYAMDVFKSHSKELKGSWENLSQMADERATLLSLSVSFHDRQQKVTLTKQFSSPNMAVPVRHVRSYIQ